MKGIILMFNVPVILGMLFFIGCTPPVKETGARYVFVSLLPQKFLVDRISGNEYQVGVLVPPGANHESYEPTPADMIRLKQSLVYFQIGLFPFEDMLLRGVQEDQRTFRLVNTSEGLDLIGQADEPGHEGHHHGPMDPHVWLSARMLNLQAETIAKALAEINPDRKELYLENLKILQTELDSLDQDVQTMIQNSGLRSFMIFHPALGYFARDYGLRQVAIEHEGKNPAPAILQNLIRTARMENIHTILIQKEFDAENAEVVARETAAVIQVFDPLAENIPATIRKVAELLTATGTGENGH